jgi:hypothetical protein
MNKAKAIITQHTCQASTAGLAHFFRDLATVLDDNPEAVLIGLWTSADEFNCDNISIQIVWDDYDSTTPIFE